MAVTVRLSRHGTRNRPFYHVVAQDRRMRLGGRFIEKLGTYDPGHEPSTIELQEDRIRFWYERGAELSGTVAKLLQVKSIKLERKQTAVRQSPGAKKSG